MALGGLASKARRLELARGVGRDGKRIAPGACVALVWSGYDESSPAVDVDSIDGMEVVITDYTITRRGVDGAPSVAVARDRVTEDRDDYGKVYAWDGSLIGRVLRSAKGGIVLEFAWPEGLAVIAGGDAPSPGDAVAAGGSSSHPPRTG